MLERRSPWTRLALALTTCFIAGCAGSPSQESQPANAFELRADRAFFWAGTPPGEEKARLYLIGSVHVLDQPIILGPEITRAFGVSDVLALEVDLRGFGFEAYTEQLSRYGTLAWGEKLEDFIGPGTIAALGQWLDRSPFAPEERQAYYRLQPWASAMLVTNASFAEQGARASLGVDQYFMARAGHEMRIVGLETLDEQFFAMSSHSYAIQERLLLEVLEAGQSGTDLTPLLDAWKKGDERALVAEMFPDPRVNAEFFETIYFARNERMSDGLVELLEAEPDVTCFAVVGVGHLVGESNVVELLEDAGYRMRRGGRR